MNLEEQPAQLESTPKPFTEIPGLWLRLGGMTETFFSQELPRASVRNTLLSMLVLSGLSALISVVIVLLSTTALGTANTTNPLETVLGIGVISIVLFCVQLIVPLKLLSKQWNNVCQRAALWGQGHIQRAILFEFAVLRPVDSDLIIVRIFFIDPYGGHIRCLRG
jgi:hypothetical protein